MEIGEDSPEPRHGAVACFHAALSILQAPLAAFATEKCAATCPVGSFDERQRKRLAKTTVHGLIQRLEDDSDGLLDADERERILGETTLLQQIIRQEMHTPVVSVKTYTRGVEAVERLLVAIGAEESAATQLARFRRLLLLPHCGVMEVSSALGDETDVVNLGDEDPSDRLRATKNEEDAGVVVDERSHSTERSMQNHTQSDLVYLAESEGDRGPNEILGSSEDPLASTPTTECALQQRVGPTDPMILTPTNQVRSEMATRCYDAANYKDAIMWCTGDIDRLNSQSRSEEAASAYVLRSQCRYALKDYESALADTDEALRLRHCKYPKASRLRVSTLLDMDRANEALLACIIAVLASPGMPELIELRDRIVRQVIPLVNAPGASKRRTELAHQANKKLINGDFAGATQSFTAAISESATYRQAATLYLYRAMCFLKVDQYKAASLDAAIAVAVKEESVKARKTLYEALIAMGKHQEASIISPQDLDVVSNNFRTEIPLNQRVECESETRDEVSSTKSSVALGPTIKKMLQDGIAHALKSKYVDAERIFGDALAMVADDSTSMRLKLLGHRARVRLAIENYAPAIDDATEGLSLQAHWVEGHRISCRGLMGLERWSRAYEACLCVLEEAPQDIAFQRIKQELLGKIQIATPKKVAPKNTAPQNQVTEMMQTGLTLFQRDRFEEAEVSFSSALEVIHQRNETFPGTVKLRVKLLGHRARCMLALANFTCAASDARGGIALQSEWVEGFRLLCRALMMLKQWRGALDACGQVLKRVPHDSSFEQIKEQLEATLQSQQLLSEDDAAQHYPSKCSAQQAGTTSVQAAPAVGSRELEVKKLKEFIRAGLALTAESKYLAAERCFSDALQLVRSSSNSKECVRLLGHRARARLAQKKYLLSIEDGREGLSLDAQWVDGHRLVCQALVCLERWSEAHEECMAVLKVVPKDAIIRNRLEELSLKLQSFKPAVQNCPFQDSMKKMMQVGISSFQQNQFRSAETVFTDALTALAVSNELAESDRLKLNVSFLGHRARCRIAMEDYEGAASDARLGIAKQSEWTEGYRILCRASMALNRWSVALSACEHVLRRAPQDVAFAQHMEKIKTMCDGKSKNETLDQLVAEGLNLNKMKHFKAAEIVFSDAIHLLGGARTRKAMQLRGHRARCRLELGMFQTALEDAQEGLLDHPDWIEGLRLSCHAYAGLEQWNEAFDACSNVLKRAPQDVAFCNLREIYREKLNGGSRELSKQGEIHRTQDDAKEQVKMPKTRLLSSPPMQVIASTTERAKLFARNGSSVAQRYLASQQFMNQALKHLQDGAITHSFRALRQALELWPRSEIPQQLARDLLLVGPHDAIAWGGPVVYSYLQAKAAGCTDLGSERDFWTKRVERYPNEARLRVMLAEVLYRCQDVKGSLEHMEKALELNGENTTSWKYLRARCLPDDTETLAVWLQGLFTRRSSRPQVREDELLIFVQNSSVDDEWMAHACYSLGMINLKKKEYVRAKHFHFLATAAESESERLGLFPVIDESVFVDKTTLNAAFTGDATVMSWSDQQRVVDTAQPNNQFCCGWCDDVVMTPTAFVRHKQLECMLKPKFFPPQICN